MVPSIGLAGLPVGDFRYRGMRSAERGVRAAELGVEPRASG